LIKKRSLSGNRLRNHTLTGKQINLGRLGKVPSASHADSAINAINATNANHASTADAATNATTAATATSVAPLPAGRSESGTFATATAGNSTTAGYLGVAISYPQPLTVPIADANIVWTGTGANVHCPGLGHADPGYLCLYDYQHVNATFFSVHSNSTNFPGPQSAGSVVFWSVAAGLAYVEGNWTVTAPPGSASDRGAVRTRGAGSVKGP
jgi:hypothetical protein